MAIVRKTVFITTTGTSTFTVPGDFLSLVSVEAIGGGAAGSITTGGTGGGGGGGGAYARSTTMTGAGLVANGTTFYSIGVAAESWFNPTSNAAPTANLSSGATGVRAAAGTIGVSGANGAGGPGGTVASSTGDLRYAGGSGGVGGPGPTSWGGAGGGAAGPGGAGGTGGTAILSAPNGTNPGGGSGATLTVAGTNGQNGQTGGIHGNGGASAGQTGGVAGIGTAQGGAGSNGGGGGGGGNGTTPSGGAGGAGTFWVQTSNGDRAGSGGGAGGSNALGGLYGGGSSAGQASGTQGIIIFTYNAKVGSGFEKPDDVFGTIDLDDQYITDSWLVDKYVGGTMFGFGSGTNGGLGIGNNTYYSSPIQVGSLASWSYVSACSTVLGNLRNYSMAIKTDGTLWAWGENRTGQLGQNYVTNTYSSPIQVGTLTNWKQVSAGQGYVLAVKTDGTAWAWGWNTYGQLGNNNRTYYSSPIQIGALNNWKQISASTGGANQSASAAVKYDGTLWTWGVNTTGVLGTAGAGNYYSSPIQVGSLTNWKQVSVGFDRTFSGSGWMVAVKTDGTLWTWGANNAGQLGNGNRTNYSSPIQIGALYNWKYVVAGHSSCMAIKTDGTLWAWGNNAQGQLGNGNRTNYSSPIQVGSLTNWKQVSIQNNNDTTSTLAIKTDGTLWGWGTGTSGQLGNNIRTNYSSPIQIGSLTNWKYVVTGGSHTIGITFTDLN